MRVKQTPCRRSYFTLIPGQRQVRDMRDTLNNFQRPKTSHKQSIQIHCNDCAATNRSYIIATNSFKANESAQWACSTVAPTLTLAMADHNLTVGARAPIHQHAAHAAHIAQVAEPMCDPLHRGRTLPSLVDLEARAGLDQEAHITRGRRGKAMSRICSTSSNAC